MWRCLLLVAAACGRLGFDASGTGRGDDTTSGDGPQPGPMVDARTDCLDPDSLALGDAFSCALRAKSMYCWGANDRGQLGLGDRVQRTTPVLVGGGVSWNVVIAGGAHACATSGATATQVASCWGANDAGQLGVADTNDRLAAANVAGTWSSITTGGRHTCGLSSSALYCWGANDRGQLGLGDMTPRSSPTKINGMANWFGGGAGASFTIFGRQGNPLGETWSFGANDRGQLGVGDTMDRATAVQVGLIDYFAYSSRGQHVCGVRPGAVLLCWGANESGQLGQGDVADRSNAVQVPGMWISIASGASHTCAVRADATLWCWGANTDGQLGTGGGDTRAPVQIGTDADWARVYAGAAHTCASKTSNVLYCWGRNAEGQLGQGGTTSRSTPTQTCIL